MYVYFTCFQSFARLHLHCPRTRARLPVRKSLVLQFTHDEIVRMVNISGAIGKRTLSPISLMSAIPCYLWGRRGLSCVSRGALSVPSVWRCDVIHGQAIGGWRLIGSRRNKSERMYVSCIVLRLNFSSYFTLIKNMCV